MDQVTLRWFSRDLNSRGVLVANALSDSLAEALLSNKAARLQPLFDRTSQDERLFAIGLCSPEGKLLQKTDRFPSSLSCVGGGGALPSCRANPGADRRAGASRCP